MNQPAAVPTQTPKKSGGCVKGCLIAVAVVIVICGIAGYYAWYHLGGYVREFGSSQLNSMTEKFLQESKLPAAEKARIETVIKGFSERVKDGQVGMEEGVNIMQAIISGPIFSNIAAESFEVAYLQKSGLSHTELEDGTATVSRFMHGILSGAISKQEADSVINLFTGEKSNGNAEEREFKPSLSDQEIRTILARMKSDADAAKIGPTPQQIDIATELDKALNQGSKSKK